MISGKTHENKMKLFRHPYSYGFAKTNYLAKKSNKFPKKIVKGIIEWQKNLRFEYVPKWMIYTAIDDATGQINKIEEIGVTAFLELNFTDSIKAETQTLVDVYITGQSKSKRSGKLKTEIKVVLSGADKKEQASATSLFVERKLQIKLQTFATDKWTEIKRKNKDKNTSDELDNLCNVDGLHYDEEIFKANITWNDGQGPQNFVHGGVVSKPIIWIFNEMFNEEPKVAKINYRKSIPLGSNSVVKGKINKGTMNFIIDGYCDGFVSSNSVI